MAAPPYQEQGQAQMAPPGYQQPQPAPGYQQPPPTQPGYPASQPQPQPQFVQPATVVAPTVVVASTMSWGETPQNYHCHLCNSDIITSVRFEIGTFTWLLAGGIFIVGFLCCAIIPFLVDSCKDVIHECPNCHQIVGKKTRM